MAATSVGLRRDILNQFKLFCLVIQA